jgi:flagellin-like hook-associated protein FlgL
MSRRALGSAAWSKPTVDRTRTTRPFRVLAIGVLVVGGLAAWAPGANASVSSVSKTCKSLNTLNQTLDKALASADTGHVDTGAVDNVSKSFRKAAKNGPKSLKSAENTIADVATSVSHTSSPTAAAATLRAAEAKLTAAVVTWGAYIRKNCSGATPATT